MKRLCLINIMLLCIISCSTVREIPIEIIERIEYRDSLVYINDTITVEIEKETVREVLPELDTSYLQTSLASSVAYLDTARRKIHHELEQKGTISFSYDTIVKVEYIDRIVEKEVPITVEVEKRYIPDIFWWSIIFNVIVLLFIGFKIYLKTKKI